MILPTFAIFWYISVSGNIFIDIKNHKAKPYRQLLFICLTSILYLLPIQQTPYQTLFFSGCLGSSQRRKWPFWRSPCVSAAAPLSWWGSGLGAACPPRPSTSWLCGGGSCPLPPTNPRPLSWLTAWPRAAGRIWPGSCCCDRLQPPGRAHWDREA